MNDKKHIAFKCAFNNGGSGKYPRYNGTCSNEIIKYNIWEKKQTWCSDNDCDCKKFALNKFQGERPVEPCYESTLFSKKYKRCFGAGYKHSGKKAGEPLKIKNAGIGKITVLTTRFPKEPEIKRRIVGLFQIGEIVDEPFQETFLVSNERFDIRIPPHVVKQVYFWDHYSTITKEADWRTGLFRYLSDKELKSMLISIQKVVDRRMKTPIGKQIQELLGNLF